MKATSTTCIFKAAKRVAMALTMSPLVFASCNNDGGNPNKDITIEAFKPYYNDKYVFDVDAIKQQLKLIVKNDNDSTQTDKRVRKMYRYDFQPIWVDRHGIDGRADTLLTFLHGIGEIGLSEDAFYVEKIEDDIKRLRELDFEGEENGINRLVARLEYRLTKAYLRYCTGQQYGFTNPYSALNSLDLVDEDSTLKVKEYRQLFDIPISRPDEKFFKHAIDIAKTDSIGVFLRQTMPHDTSLNELKAQLKLADTNKKWWLVMCNMERHRWRRTFQPADPYGRKVVVNIPSFRLYAYGPDSVMTMKVGCGATKTKTPLLTSAINRMDVNPLWNIPMSIIRNDVAKHAGDTHYFTSRRYFIVDKNTGKTVSPNNVTPAMLKSGQYRVSQEGGEGNSLGRIIFRFDNKFSVYLHDTSSRRFFDQSIRSVSHGCIRIERPFDFAKYLLGENVDSWTLDKIRIAMDITPETEKGLRYVSDTTRTRKLINSKKIDPQVPLFIIYQTMFKTPEGRWEEYADIYGYDGVMKRQLAPFVSKKRRSKK